MHTKRYIQLVLLIGVGFLWPAVAFANMGTPLMWGATLHLLIGNTLLGGIEGRILTKLFNLTKWKPILIMIVGNYASAGIAALILANFRPDLAIHNIQAASYAFFLSAYIFTLFLEAPFVAIILRKEKNLVGKILRGTIVTQSITYAPLAVWYGLISYNSMLSQVEVVPLKDIGLPKGIAIYFLDNQSPEINQVTGKDHESKTAKKFESGYNHKSWETKKNVRGLFDLYANLDEKSILIAQDFATDVGSRKEGRGTTTIIQPKGVPDSRWETHRGFWAAEGLSVTDTKGEESYRVSLETPYAAWMVKEVTQLPSDQVIFQFGQNQVVVLDIASKKMALIGKGTKPVVGLWVGESLEDRLKLPEPGELPRIDDLLTCAPPLESPENGICCKKGSIKSQKFYNKEGDLVRTRFQACERHGYNIVSNGIAQEVKSIEKYIDGTPTKRGFHFYKGNLLGEYLESHLDGTIDSRCYDEKLRVVSEGRFKSIRERKVRLGKWKIFSYSRNVFFNVDYDTETKIPAVESCPIGGGNCKAVELAKTPDLVSSVGPNIMGYYPKDLMRPPSPFEWLCGTKLAHTSPSESDLAGILDGTVFVTGWSPGTYLESGHLLVSKVTKDKCLMKLFFEHPYWAWIDCDPNKVEPIGALLTSGSYSTIVPRYPGSVRTRPSHTAKHGFGLFGGSSTYYVETLEIVEGDGELWVKGKVAWDSPEPEFDSEGNVINPEKPEFESSTIFFPLLNHNRLNMTHPKGYY